MRLILPLLCVAVVLGCTRETSEPISPSTDSSIPSDVKVEVYDREIGTGKEVQEGQTLIVHYTGTLMDGTKFDSSVERKRPFSFVLGAKRVIPGWEQGIKGMRVGGKRTLVVPSVLAYGARGLPPKVPANSDLKFEIEVIEVR